MEKRSLAPSVTVDTTLCACRSANMSLQDRIAREMLDANSLLVTGLCLNTFMGCHLLLGRPLATAVARDRPYHKQSD